MCSIESVSPWLFVIEQFILVISEVVFDQSRLLMHMYVAYNNNNNTTTYKAP